jgi:ABC-type phosphate transport system auxiliary subunit
MKVTASISWVQRCEVTVTVPDDATREQTYEAIRAAEREWRGSSFVTGISKETDDGQFISYHGDLNGVESAFRKENT